MATLIERVYSLIKQIKPKISDDQELSEAWLEEEINIVRAAIARETYKAHGDLKSFYQTIPVIGVIPDDITLDEGSLSTATQVADIPRLMEGVGQADILGLVSALPGAPGSVRSLPSRVSHQEFRSMHAVAFGSDMPIFCYDDGKLLIRTNSPVAFSGKLIAIFKDPREVPYFDRETTEYPMSSEYKIELLVKQHLFSSLNIPVDPVQDDFDASQPSGMSTAGEQQKQK